MLTQQTRLTQLTRVFGKSRAVAATWILGFGAWNDNGRWLDSEQWSDGS